MEIGDWRAEARGCVKIIRPEIFDKSSPVNKAKVYHTGSKHYIWDKYLLACDCLNTEISKKSI